MKDILDSLTRSRSILGDCKEAMNEFDRAMMHTLHSSKEHNDEINAARERMKICLREMKASELPPRKERKARE